MHFCILLSNPIGFIMKDILSFLYNVLPTIYYSLFHHLISGLPLYFFLPSPQLGGNFFRIFFRTFYFFLGISLIFWLKNNRWWNLVLKFGIYSERTKTVLIRYLDAGFVSGCWIVLYSNAIRKPEKFVRLTKGPDFG